MLTVWAVMALTATATEEVQNDIVDKLAIRECKMYRASFNRKNLRYCQDTLCTHLILIGIMCVKRSGTFSRQCMRWAYLLAKLFYPHSVTDAVHQ